MTNPIQFQDKFNSLAKAVDMQPDEEAIAKFFWYAGLRHAFQRGTSEAALLKPSVPARGKETTVKYKPEPAAYKGYTSELSPYEAKLISLILTQVMHNGQEGVADLKAIANGLWNYCDKDKKGTEEVFKEMNRIRSKIKTVKSQLNSLASAQRTLKKISKDL